MKLFVVVVSIQYYTVVVLPLFREKDSEKE